MRNKTNILLCLISIIFLTLIFCEMFVSAPLPVFETSSISKKISAPVIQVDNKKLVSVILERPIFEPSRRPFSPPMVPATNTLPDLQLTGIILTAQERKAMILTSNKKTFVVSRGEHVDRFVIRLITADKVTVDGPSGLLTLVLSYKKSDKAMEGSSENFSKSSSSYVDPGWIKDPETASFLISNNSKITKTGTVISSEPTNAQNAERARSRFGPTGRSFR